MRYENDMNPNDLLPEVQNSLKIRYLGNKDLRILRKVLSLVFRPSKCLRKTN